MSLLTDSAMQSLKQQLMRHEGFESEPYLCTAGKLTIGYGRNIEDKGISKREAEYLLENDIEEVVSAIEARIPVFSVLTDARKSVLINMAFNLGLNGLCRFNNMLSALQHQDYLLAANEMLDSKWARQVGARAHELAEQMRRGEM